MKVDLPDGAWAHLRDPKQVPERLRRPYASKMQSMAKYKPVFDRIKKAASEEEKAAITAELPPECIEGFSESNDLMVVALVDEWSFDTPVTIDTVLDLPAGQYDALRTAVAPFLSELMPDYGPSPDPKAPTDS